MKKTIIIAKSIQSEIDISNTLFSRGGVSVIAAASCEEILHLHRSDKADLIIADLRLPVMGGVRLVSSIRSDPSLKDVSIVMVCDASEPALNECRQAGVNAALTRPLDASSLFSTVSQMLMVQQRMAVRIPLRITVQGVDAPSTLIGISRDISASGMRLESGRILQPGERLECCFTLNSRVVTVSCVVARVHQSLEGGFQYGVKFLNLDAKTFILIEHFVKSCGPQGLPE